MVVTKTDIALVEKILLPDDCHFSDDAQEVIKCWENREILACPGSGKTTVLLAKLKLLADEMPLKEGRGVCVLSHTNVAVNELKNKLGESAKKLLEYPNFVGTLQSFVDQYVTFPYLKQQSSNPIQVVSKADYSVALLSKIKKNYKILDGFISQQYKNIYSSVFSNKVDFVAALNWECGELYIRNGKPKKLAGSASPSAQSYANVTKDLLFEEGLICYEDAYKYTLSALEKYGESFRRLLSRRFQYVFVDEYQDCSQIQRDVLNALFVNSESVLQKIGDVDQSIYSNDSDDTSEWQVSRDYLSIADTNRYGQEIADILTLLRIDKQPIYSARGTRGIKPTILLYDSTSQCQVLPAFINEILENNLVFSNGIYKAIGMYKNVTGLKIGDYWPGFRPNTSTKLQINYSDYIYQICQKIMNGDLFKAEKDIRKLLCRIYHYLGLKNETGKKYSINSIKKYLENNYINEYQTCILQLSQLKAYTYDTIDMHIKTLLIGLIGAEALEKLPETFMKQSSEIVCDNAKANTYEDYENSIEVIFDTVFGAKGETHDATLYLETEKNRGSDLKRIIPLLEGKSLSGKGSIYEKSRKCVYVGFSRPRYLLCLAMRKSTYQGHETAFSDWKIVDLT